MNSPEQTGAETVEMPPLHLRAPPFAERFPWIGGDLQTLRNFFMVELRGRRQAPEKSTRLTIPLEDGTGDSLIAEYSPADSGGRPAVVLIHGLTGCSGSSYIEKTAALLVAAGHPVLRLNLRGAGPGLAHASDCYHAGRHQDLRHFLYQLSQRHPEITAQGLAIIGYSLGGNMLLNHLGFRAASGDTAGVDIRAAVCVCAPIDLKATSTHFRRKRNALYQRWLLARMKEEMLPLPFTAEEKRAIEQARSVYEFDDRFLAPHFGFDGAEHYYAETSGQNFLDTVPVPTLLLHSRNDPWVPVRSYEAAPVDGNPNLSMILAPSGGHVGFHQRHPSNLPWHDQVILEFLQSFDGGRAARGYQ